jgi:hypothetical protein
METLTQKRLELKNVNKQINTICKKPLYQWNYVNDETRAFYLGRLKTLEFKKIDLLDEIIKMQNN